MYPFVLTMQNVIKNLCIQRKIASIFGNGKVATSWLIICTTLRIFVVLEGLQPVFPWRENCRSSQVIHHELIHNIAIYRQPVHFGILPLYHTVKKFSQSQSYIFWTDCVFENFCNTNSLISLWQLISTKVSRPSPFKGVNSAVVLSLDNVYTWFQWSVLLISNGEAMHFVFTTAIKLFQVAADIDKITSK